MTLSGSIRAQSLNPWALPTAINLNPCGILNRFFIS